MAILDGRPPWSPLVDLILPRTCVACGEATGPAPSLGLCPDCAERLAPLPKPACSQCALPLPRGVAMGACGACLQRPAPWSMLHVGWLYRPPFDQVIRAVKFGRLDYLAEELGRRLAEGLRHELATAELVVPVPLHWRRQLQRGFDQAALIAAGVGRVLERPVVRALRRRRATPPQTRRGRDRRLGSLAGAFMSTQGSALRGRHVLLADDVVTTGATLTAAARALLPHRPASLLVLAAARTLPLSRTGARGQGPGAGDQGAGDRGPGAGDRGPRGSATPQVDFEG